MHEGKNCMILCIFADIHGNSEAFNKMIDNELDIVDGFVFAGDVFGYFYGQSEIIDKLMALPGLTAIKGNHEKYYLRGERKEELLNKYGSSYDLKLTQCQRQYIEHLPEHAELFIDGKRIGIFHGGPEDSLEQRIYPDSQFFSSTMGLEYDYLIIAHTHYRLIKKTGKTTVINPGSLGQPRDRNGFSYCLLNTENGACVFKTIEVNIRNLLCQVKDIDSDKYVYEYLENKYQ